MNLKEFLFFERKIHKEFSEELFISRNYLTLIVNQKVKPSKRLAKAIEIATQGKVTAEEVLNPQKPLK